MSKIQREVIFEGYIGDNNVLEGIGPFTINSCDSEEKTNILKRFLLAIIACKYNGDFKLMEVSPIVTSYICLPYSNIFKSPEIKKTIMFEGFFDTCGEKVILEDFSDSEIECVKEFFNDLSNQNVLVSYNFVVNIVHTDK